MKKHPIYASYYTTGTPYEAEAAELLVTLRQMGLDKRADIAAVPTLGDWTVNCAQKPMVVRNAMLRHEGHPIVFLDADARVRKYPHLFDSFPADVDAAFHLLDGHELLSGTLYFGGTPSAWALVQAWCEECQKHPGVWDQVSLAKVLDADPFTYRTAELPEAYVSIFDRGTVPADRVVIQHMQASRRLRERV